MMPVDDDDQSWCKGAVEDARVATIPDTHSELQDMLGLHSPRTVEE